ncbi:hypothetical protein HVX25_24440 (plasmid) [Escherichia coli]|uniref:hypothetical protein n=1 Tax=Escherichia coli TaxID=562 RepID=UPI000BE62712|nr:hypothetical protein [Escherichia coli]EEW1865268.1 hypothetical protein [Escherichia coli]EEX1868121.1 hypothetical protein [Escherichia coli]EFB3120095.1 hypothetical protein [Escherichia coli]EFC0722376.1 hypothetical protein [Escherichia coli]EFL9430385.1 hypothetical protein [Escherichia coli]
MNDLLVERASAFVKSPLDNPLTRGEQMELARWFLHIHEQMEVFKQLPDLPITDGHVQQVINSHEKGWAMIVPCKITYELAKEVQANRARSKEE